MLIAEFFIGVVLVFLIGYFIGNFFKLNYNREFGSLKEKKKPEEIKEPEYKEQMTDVS